MAPNANIMSVCDDHATNEYMRDLFRYFGYSLVVAETLEDVQDIMSHSLIECVIVDLDMIDGEAEEILGWLRGFSHTVPVVVTSFDADFGMEAKLVALGVTDVLAKPLDSRMIARTIRIVRESQKASSGF